MQPVCFSNGVQLSKGMTVDGNRNPHNLRSLTRAGGTEHSEPECIMLDKTAKCALSYQLEIYRSQAVEIKLAFVVFCYQPQKTNPTNQHCIAQKNTKSNILNQQSPSPCVSAPE